MISAREHGMSLALTQARQALLKKEVPVGAVIIQCDEVIGVGFNQSISSHDPTAHAEIVALREAAASTGNYRLPGAILYVTIEPCTMCVGAMIHARISKVVFGAREPRAGALVSNLQLHQSAVYNHQLEVEEGVLADECRALMKNFFRARRERTGDTKN